MKKFSLTLFAAVGLAATVAHAQEANPSIVISQVYGAGGNSGAVYQADYVELHNRSSAPINLSGYTLRYASAAGTSYASAITLSATNLTAGRSLTVPAGGYFLVRVSAAGSTATQTAVDADVTSTAISMAAAAGKIALYNSNTLNSALAVCSQLNGGAAELVDFVGWGTTASCGETTPAPATSTTLAIFRANNGCTDTNSNVADFTSSAPLPRNSLTAPFLCGSSIPDCNNNTIDDRTEIDNAGGTGGFGGTLDCNNNGGLDSCEISPTTDRNANSILDYCEINAAGGTNGIGGSLDCNSNGTLDSADISVNPRLDELSSDGSLVADGLLDSCQTPGAGQDCNNNSVLDGWELRVGTLTDVDANNIPDACEGAIVKEVDENATVQPAGVRGGATGTDFFNVEEFAAPNAFDSYGGLRWDIAALNLPSGFSAGRVYLWLQQSNAAFTASSIFPEDGIDIAYTANDTIDFTPGVTTTDYDNLATDYTDLAVAATYAFTRSSAPNLFPSSSSGGNGAIDTYKLFDSTGGNLSGGDAIAAKLTGNAGKLTLVIKGADVNTGVFAATYAGRTNTLYTGPQIVIFPAGNTGPVCNDLDFNNDGNIEPLDIDAYFSILGEGPCLGGTACDSLDFNNDGNIEPLDIDSYFSVLGEGPCT